MQAEETYEEKTDLMFSFRLGVKRVGCPTLVNKGNTKLRG